MRFIITLIWSFILCSAITYILSSMGQQEFQLQNAVIVSTLLAVIVFIIGEMLVSFQKEDSEA